MFLFNVDKAFEKLGFVKIENENPHVIQYERKKEQGYIQCLDLVYKNSGKHIIQSYQKDINKDGFNNMVGLTAREAVLAAKKMRQVGWKSSR